MKVLQVIESLGRGGAEQALVNLLPSLQEQGLECEIAVLWPPYTLAGDLERTGIHVRRLDLGHRWNLLRARRRLSALFRRGGYDIIHAHLFFAYLYTALAPIDAKTHRVVSFHNETFVGYPANTLWKKLRKAFERRALHKGYQRYIAVSQAVAVHHREHLGIGRIDIIPNAFPIKALRPKADLDIDAERNVYGITANDFLMVLAGRLVAQKGHTFLLQAMANLKSLGVTPKLLLFGDGPLEMEIRSRIREYDLAEQVQLHSALPHQKLLRIVQACDLFVMPSLFEGFGLAPAEAMALERPVVASAVGGLTDLVESGISGVLVPPADPEALAKAFRDLMQRTEARVAMGKAARRRIEDRFSAEVVSALYGNYYRELTRGN